MVDLNFNFQDVEFAPTPFVRESDILTVGTPTSSRDGSRGNMVTGKTLYSRDIISVNTGFRWKYAWAKTNQQMKDVQKRIDILKKKTRLLRALSERASRELSVKMHITRDEWGEAVAIGSGWAAQFSDKWANKPSNITESNYIIMIAGGNRNAGGSTDDFWYTLGKGGLSGSEVFGADGSGPPPTFSGVTCAGLKFTTHTDSGTDYPNWFIYRARYANNIWASAGLGGPHRFLTISKKGTF